MSMKLIHKCLILTGYSLLIYHIKRMTDTVLKSFIQFNVVIVFDNTPLLLITFRVLHPFHELII